MAEHDYSITVQARINDETFKFGVFDNDLDEALSRVRSVLAGLIVDRVNRASSNVADAQTYLKRWQSALDTIKAKDDHILGGAE